MEIHYVTSHPELIKGLHGCFNKTKCSFHSLDVEKHSEIDILLLFSPFFYNNIYISAELTWKNYLEQTNPEAIFLVAGFSKLRPSNSNYIDLVNLPDDFQGFISTAKKAKENWQPVNTGGLDMNDKLMRFFEGHGEESVTDVLGRMQMIFKIVDRGINVRKESFEHAMSKTLKDGYILNKWAELQNRWASYFPFFGFLPFYSIFQEVEMRLKDIQPFFESKCKNESLYTQLNCVSQLNQIKKQLTIAKQYVS